MQLLCHRLKFLAKCLAGLAMGVALAVSAQQTPPQEPEVGEKLLAEVGRWVQQTQQLTSDQFGFAPMDSRVQLQTCDRPLVMDLPFASRETIRVRCLGNPNWQVYMRVLLKPGVSAAAVPKAAATGSNNQSGIAAKRKVVVASQLLRAGSRVSVAVLQEIEHSGEGLDPQAVGSIKDVENGEMVRDVAAGDLRPKPFLQGKDELDGLTRSFSVMTQQLFEARNTVERSMAQLDLARSHLQTMLDNLTAGVVLLDDTAKVLSINPGANRILKLNLPIDVGSSFLDMDGLQEFARQVIDQFHELASEKQGRLDHWEQSFELDATPLTSAKNFSPQSERQVTLVARGALLPQGEWLLVFDDISDIVSAQRSQAWTEVARRLAHEIKNPLTPIQLSAERLAMKLDGKLPEMEQALLTKSVKTIVEQVDALQRLVNEFRDFGRLPAARLQALDLNALLTEMMALYSNENARVPVAWELQTGLPWVMGDAAWPWKSML